ncbi:MAG: pilus assembly protein PilM [Phycisphaerae bacterium]|nr:pilus assembly protein PilM [Phycisphaerae bacterium]
MAIDWDAQSLRVLHFRARNGRVEILKALSIPLPAGLRLDDAESLGAFLRQALAQAGIRDRRAVIDIPRDQVVLNTLTVPPSTLDELPALVHFQVVKELPFAADQATLDFAVRGEFDAKSPCDVLVAAVRNEVLASYQRVATEAGLKLERIGLRPHANLVAFTSGSSIAKAARILAVDIGPQLTEINVICDGGLVFSRAATVRLPFGGVDDAGGETLDSRVQVHPGRALEANDEQSREAVAAVVVEVLRSIEAYRATEPSAGLERIIVAGATGIEDAVAEALHARFNVHAELYNPANALDVTPQRARVLRGFSAAIGLALGLGAVGPNQFNFLSPKKAVTRSAKQLRKAPAAVLVGAVAILAILVARRYALEPKLERIRSLQGAIAQLEKELKGHRQGKRQIDGVRALEDRVKSIQKWLDEEQVWPAHLAALTRAFPSDKDAYATRVLFTDQPPRIDIDLRTRRAQVSAGIVQRLGSLGIEAIVGKSTTSPGKDDFSFTDNIGVGLTRVAPTTAPSQPKTRGPETRPAEDQRS